MTDIVMRECPHCFGEVDARATVCRHCRGAIPIPTQPTRSLTGREKVFLGIAGALALGLFVFGWPKDSTRRPAGVATVSRPKAIGSEVAILKSVPACRSLEELKEAMRFHSAGNARGLTQLEASSRCIALKVGAGASLIGRPEPFIVQVRVYDPQGGGNSVDLWTFKEAIE